MSVTVCPDDIVWTAEHFVTKLGIVMKHHEPVCQVGNNCLLSSRSRSQRGRIWSKYDSFYYIFWTVDSLATKLGLMIHHHKPECLVKNIGLLHSRSRSQWMVKMSIFVQMISAKLPNILLPNLVLWCINMSQSACKKIGLLFSRSRSQQGLIRSKYDNYYCVLWTADPFACFDSTLS